MALITEEWSSGWDGAFVLSYTYNDATGKVVSIEVAKTDRRPLFLRAEVAGEVVFKRLVTRTEVLTLPADRGVLRTVEAVREPILDERGLPTGREEIVLERPAPDIKITMRFPA